MAKDDYFVLAYKILSYLYRCLKRDEMVDENYISHEALGIGISYWEYIISHLNEEGYIEGITFIPVLGKKAGAIRTGEINITPKGIDFLQNNSAMAKAKKVLKELNELIPF